MPSKSKKQHRFMQAAAHNPKFAKKAGIKPSVAKEFVAADAGIHVASHRDCYDAKRKRVKY
jgi:hypothetical protein